MMNWNNYNSNWKKLLGFRNTQEMLEKTITMFSFQVNKSNVEAYVHIEKGGAHQELDEDKNNHALVRFSGYVARWARNSSKRLGEPNCDEHCLPRKIFFSLKHK